MKRLEAPYTIEFMMRQLPRSQEFAPTWTFDPAFKGGRPSFWVKTIHVIYYKWNSLGVKRGMENIYLNMSI